jgi:hypothetical protein
VAQAIAIVQSSLAASKDVANKRAALEASLEAERAVRGTNKVFVSALKQTLQAMFVGQVDTLAQYGLKGRKPSVVPPKTKVASAARAQATRKLRGTKGSKQKREVQSPPVVEVTTSTTPPASPEPVTTPTPAPAVAPAPAPTPSAAPALAPKA